MTGWPLFLNGLLNPVSQVAEAKNMFSTE